MLSGDTVTERLTLGRLVGSDDDGDVVQLSVWPTRTTLIHTNVLRQGVYAGQAGLSCIEIYACARNTTAAVRHWNSVVEYILTNDKEIKKHHSRGYMENLICNTSEVVLTKWYDNSSVALASNFCGIGQPDQCRRYDKKQKIYINVQRPEVVARYNEGMGGVDKCDHLLSLYRIFIRSRKWTLRLITHGIDMAVINSWVEYKKETKNLGLHEKKILDLIHFRQYLAEALILSGKTIAKKRGRPSNSPTTSITLTPKTKQLRPINDVRLDDIGHLPVFLDKKVAGRCKNLGCKSKTYVSCKKCNVNLCIAHNKNCFD